MSFPRVIKWAAREVRACVCVCFILMCYFTPGKANIFPSNYPRRVLSPVRCPGQQCLVCGCLSEAAWAPPHNGYTTISASSGYAHSHHVLQSPQRCPDIYFIPMRVRLHLSSRSKTFISANGHRLHRRCINPGLCITDVRLLFKCKTSYIHLLTLFRNHFH